MQQNTRDDITVDRCDDCTLTWFDRGELEQACADLPRPQGLEPAPPSALGPEALGESDYRCPRCNKRAVRVGYVAAPLLRMDLCETHGVLVSDEQLHLLGQELVKATLGEQHTPHDDAAAVVGIGVGLVVEGQTIVWLIRLLGY